jgi:mono/diheme cytochrome c family protein
MKSMPTRATLWFICTAVVAVAALGAQSSSNDDEKGRALVESKCTLCHGLDEVRVANLDKPGWKELVESMRTKGADLKDDEVAVIVDYLVKTYSHDSGAEAKKLVEGSCGSCHGMDVVTSAQKTKEEWTGVVREMISYGATLQESQIPEVADYLAKNYGLKK